MSGRSATFRLSSGQDLALIVSLHQASESSLPADIAFRFLQRLSLATAERLERLLAGEHASEARGRARSADLAERTVGRRDRDRARGAGGRPGHLADLALTPFAKLAPRGAWAGRRDPRPPAPRSETSDWRGISHGWDPTLRRAPASPRVARNRAAHSPAPSLPKGSSDYLRALRRRTWLVLAIGVTLSVAGAVLVVRLPAVYRATAQISIEPPAYDPVLSTLVSHDMGATTPKPH